jgi:L-seryl-tRNA(Ser) seleniumtransferase
MQNRRTFLQTLSSLPLLGSLVPARAEPTPATRRDFFKELGVRPIINAAGTYTVLTASLMPPEVIEAMNQAARQFCNLNELQVAVGKRIAQLIGCDAAMVTSGAAAALTVGTAACLTGKNPDFIHRIPDLTGMKSEVIIQKSHRYSYDHAVRNCGIRFIEVETADELERAINDRTAMMLFFNDAEPKGKINAEQFAALGRKHGIPTFNDAAADVPPTENLWKYTKMGFDLVTFSGGKGLRGPQSCGLLLGRRDLIEAARLNCSPNSDSIGRGMKVNKEEMIGMLAAVELYLKRDAAAEWREWERRIKVLTDSLAHNKAITATAHVPPIANHVPHLKLSWDKTVLQLTSAEVRKQLREGVPSIEIVPSSSPPDSSRQEVTIGVWQLQPGEVVIVARRLREILDGTRPTQNRSGS